MNYKNVVISLGGNFEETLHIFYEIENLFNKHNEIAINKKSSLYLTSPVDYTNQLFFLNKVLLLETNMDILSFFEFIQNLEKEYGRKKYILKGPRNIDIDILYWDNLMFKNDFLVVPHKSIYERKFILEMLTEIIPQFVPPNKNQPIHKINSNFYSDEQIIKLFYV